MASIFAKIIQNEIPSFKVAEDDEFLAFLDIQPLSEGHVLVVPKKEVDYIFDLEDELLGRMIQFAKLVAKKMDNAFNCKRIGVSVVGLEVPHAHIHLIPINSVQDMNFSKEKLSYTQNELKEIAQKIIAS